MNSEQLMAQALKLASRGRYTTQPNPMVGCIITKNNQIIGKGWHQSYGSDHAEVNAIKNCKKKYGSKQATKLLKGSHVYVNLEPCSITNNTPPCIDALLQIGVQEVTCGTLDPNPRINGKGVRALRKNGVKVSVGVLRKECESLNRIFFTNQKKQRPYIILKGAQSIDGKIALKSGQSKWITNDASRKDAHKTRALVKGILVGKKTIEHDNPNLDMRLSAQELGLTKNAPTPQPIKIILGSPSSNWNAKNILSGGTAVIVAANQFARKIKNAECIQYKKKDFLAELMNELLTKDITSVLVEGGAKTLNGFMSKGLFDELVLYTAPIMMGRESISAFNLKAPTLVSEAQKLSLEKLEIFHEDIKVTYLNK